MKQLKIAVIVGSLRKESFNKKMAKALVENAPETLSFEFLEIGNLELYTQEFDANSPKSWVDFREKVKGFDGVLCNHPKSAVIDKKRT